IEGEPTPTANSWYGQYIGAFSAAKSQGATDEQAHAAARAFADQGRPADGSQQVEDLKKRGIETPINKGGARFKARNYFWHNEVMYNFNKIIDPKTLEIVAGAHLRRYRPNTSGTIFDDANNLDEQAGNQDLRIRDISVIEVGAYAQFTKRLFADRWKIVAAARIDKNQNFEARFTPRISNVITLGEKRNHNFRLSYQTGFRNPTMLDQYQNLTVGGVVTLIGALPEFRERYFGNSPIIDFASTLATPQNPNPTPRQIELGNFRPEFVQTTEIGYKGIWFKNLFIDTYFYYNWYDNYNGSNLVVAPLAPRAENQAKVFQVPTNPDVNLRSMGWGLGLEYRFSKGYNLTTNVSRDVLANPSSEFDRTGFIPAFNSPGYRTNVALSNRNLFKGFGFNLVWRWQDSFRWQSGGFFSGDIPAYHSVDLNFNYKLKSLKSILKIGGSNIFNQRYFQAYGNPRLGSTYYISITFDEILN
ncbi:MAG: TonB-dependent receptor, partial [Microscillaceae bacterium]|nr:TonB-dependent receptor [Microscillaceae bacterium]